MPLSLKKLRERSVFVVDECLGSTFAAELRHLSSLEVKNFDEVWPAGEKDPEVIRKSASQNLIILTLDARMRVQHRDVVFKNNARVIVFNGNKGTPKEMAKWFAASEAKIERFIRENDPPFFARFSLPTQSQIKKKLKPQGRIDLQSNMR